MLLHFYELSNGKGVSNIGRPLAMSHKSCKFNFWKPMPNFSQVLAKTFQQSIKVPTPNFRQSSSFAKVFESSSHKSGRFFFTKKWKKRWQVKKEKKLSSCLRSWIGSFQKFLIEDFHHFLAGLWLSYSRVLKNRNSKIRNLNSTYEVVHRPLL